MKTVDVVGVWALGAALVLALVGVVIIAAIGRPIPSELWAMITMVGGALAAVVRGAVQSSGDVEPSKDIDIEARAARRIKAERLRAELAALEESK
jgi:hypothetical protein